MDVDVLRDWAGVIAFLISTAAMLHSWFTSKSRINAEHLKRVDVRMNSHSNRLQQIETDIKHLPEKDDVNDLKLKLSELNGVVGRLDEGMSHLSRTVSRVEEFLISNGSK